MRKKTKFLLLRASVIAAFAILSGRLWYVQVVMGSYYKQQADTSKIRLLPVQAWRGIIYDRNGKQLVFNAPSWRVTIVPHGIPGQGATSIYRLLSWLLGGDPTPSAIASIVKTNEWRAYAPIPVKTDVSASTAMLIRQLHSRLPGVIADPTSVRQYNDNPQFSMAHILGYNGTISPDQYAADRRAYPAEHYGSSDDVGQAGLEAALDPYMHGVYGTEQVEVDAGERPVRILRHGTFVPGDSVYLTIDSNLQAQVSADLQAALAKVGLRQGVAVVEDVHTGAILSMVSLPGYDSNWFAGQISTKHYSALLHDPAHPLTDLATQGVYPPGSTYKIITAAAALQTGVANPSRFIDDTGSIKLQGHTFFGWNPNGLGEMNIISAISHSSDIYFYTVAGGNPLIDPNMPQVGPTRLAHYARLFGLGSSTNLEIPDASGLVPDPAWYSHQGLPLRNPGDTWHIGDTYNMAIGQGFNLATPLQMANATATIANGGTLYQPHIVDHIYGRIVPRKGVLAKPQIVQPFVPNPVRSHVISPDNNSLIQEGMHDSVRLPNWQGTSYLVQDPRIDAAGKTGTAEAKLPNGVADPHAWWVGYAPFQHPKIAVCVLIPNANSEGAYIAAPIAHKVFEDYFHLKPKVFDIPNSTSWLDDVSQQFATAGGAQ
ncbi:MAG TPA: penicillin-binding protein 2 [Chloroflexota bacterium]